MDLYQTEKSKILNCASMLLEQNDFCLTSSTCPRSAGGPHDYYSEGDYWWPNPDSPDGLPYIKKDGQSNPENFSDHRHALRGADERISAFAAAFMASGEDKYAKAAERQLETFFLSPDTRMNPHLLYAQAVPGICTGRGIGIIDTLHLIDTVRAAETLKQNSAIAPEIYDGIRNWFAEYLNWLVTHPYGQAEMNEPNNHSVCFLVQAAAFADFTKNEQVIEICLDRFKNVIIPDQMAPDGSFPRELARTKPYCYSLFQIDNLCILCHILSRYENLWSFALPDGRSMRRAIEYIYPYIKDKSAWPHKPDIMHFSDWPLRSPSLFFAGPGLEEDKYLNLWQILPDKIPSDEAARNLAITQYALWQKR